MAIAHLHHWHRGAVGHIAWRGRRSAAERSNCQRQERQDCKDQSDHPPTMRDVTSVSSPTPSARGRPPVSTMSASAIAVSRWTMGSHLQPAAKSDMNGRQVQEGMNAVRASDNGSKRPCDELNEGPLSRAPASIADRPLAAPKAPLPPPCATGPLGAARVRTKTAVAYHGRMLSGSDWRLVDPEGRLLQRLSTGDNASAREKLSLSFTVDRQRPSQVSGNIHCRIWHV